MGYEEEEVMMGYAIGSRGGVRVVSYERSALGFLARIAGALACVALAIVVSMCVAPSDAYASGVRTASETYYVAGASDGHLWAKDTIEFEYADGKVVSKPTVEQQASAVCKIQEGIRGPVYGCYFKDKSPKIEYHEGARTATVKTYWVCKQGFSVKLLDVSWHKTCTVTYTCDGDGKITVSKKYGHLQLG